MHQCSRAIAGPSMRMPHHRVERLLRCVAPSQPSPLCSPLHSAAAVQFVLVVNDVEVGQVVAGDVLDLEAVAAIRRVVEGAVDARGRKDTERTNKQQESKKKAEEKQGAVRRLAVKDS